MKGKNRFFSNRTHPNIQVLAQFMDCPEFLEARVKNYISFRDLRDIDSQVLAQSLEKLFSKENASQTLNALNEGHFSIDEYLQSEMAQRKYLSEFQP